MTTALLDREMYSEAEAARLLGIPQATLNYWLEGGERRGTTYAPVIRPEPRGGRAAVTWAEFIEAGLLCSYRTAHVPMRELRQFIELLRTRYGVPFPLAHQRPFVGDRELLFADQEQVAIDPEFALVVNLRGQYVLTPAPDRFFRQVTWNGDIAKSWRPSEDPISPVLIDPDHRFGRPAIRGISTETILEHHRAGADDDDIAETFELSPDDVVWALAYELGSERAAA